MAAELVLAASIKLLHHPQTISCLLKATEKSKPTNAGSNCLLEFHKTQDVLATTLTIAGSTVRLQAPFDLMPELQLQPGQFAFFLLTSKDADVYTATQIYKLDQLLSCEKMTHTTAGEAFLAEIKAARAFRPHTHILKRKRPDWDADETNAVRAACFTPTKTSH